MQIQKHRRKSPIPASVRRIPQSFKDGIPPGYAIPGKSKTGSKKKSKAILYIPDTNVLMEDHRAPGAFKEHSVIIPMKVVEELDKLKSDKDQERAGKARAASRFIEECGIGHKFTELESGGHVRVDPIFRIFPSEETNGLDLSKSDNQIIMCAYWHHVQNLRNKEYAHVVFVSNDNNAIIKGRALGMRCQKYRTNAPEIQDDVYLKKMFLSHDLMQSLGGQNFATEALSDHKKIQEFVSENGIVENEGVIVCFDDKKKTPHLACVWKDGRMKKVGPCNKQVYENGSVKPYVPDYYKKTHKFNFGHEVFIENLFDPKISLFSGYGKAGTGKTMTAVRAALHMLLKDKLYDRLIISRPIVSSGGKGIGFLPGSKEEKMGPWISPIRECIISWLEQEYSTPEAKIKSLAMRFSKKDGENAYAENSKRPSANGDNHASARAMFDELLADGIIQIETTEHVRGNSYERTIVIIDEAQNMSGDEGKTWITRMGQGSKLFLLGDLDQVDNPYLRHNNNALAIIGYKTRGQYWAATIHLELGVRSIMSDWAAQNL